MNLGDSERYSIACLQLMKKHHIEVEKRLKRQAKARTASAARVKRYMNSELHFLGYTVPEQRSFALKGYSFSKLSLKKQIQIWDYIWKNSGTSEAMSQALLFCEKFSRSEELIELWPTLKHWSSRIENWAHSDSLSSFYSQILELAPNKILPTLKRWNKDKHPWKRRLSIVSLLYYSRERKTYLPYKTLEAMVKPLLQDSHVYVQKGVGWTLREMGNVYPAQTKKFVKQNCLKLSSIAFTTATEKWTAREKAQLKRMRKTHRSKS